MATIKALLINPVARTVSQVTIKETPGLLAAMRVHLGCQWVDRMQLTPREDLWIDDEGRYAYPNPHGYFKIGGQVICGRGLVLGHNGDGESCSTRAMPAALAMAIEWIDIPEMHTVEPSIAVTAWGDA